MISKEYINSIFRFSVFHFIKNQIKLILNFFDLLKFSITNSLFLGTFKYSKNIFISLSHNNYSTFYHFKEIYKTGGEIISYNDYGNKNKSLIFLDLLNTFFGIFIHLCFFPAIFFFFYKNKKRLFIYSDEIAKSIISILTIKIIKIENIDNIFISNDHNYFTRQLIKRAKLFNKKSIFIAHGQPSESYPKPITDYIFLDNNISKNIYINLFNANPNNIIIIEYPKLNNYKFDQEEFDFGICSTPSMSINDILFIIEELSKSYRIIFRPHPSLIKDNHHFLKGLVEYSNPLKEDIKSFYQKSKKIITGNSGVLFESLFLKKTTFLWTENVENKFADINNKDRYNVLKNNYCLELNVTNFHANILKEHIINNKKYYDLFPMGVNNFNNNYSKINKLISK